MKKYDINRRCKKEFSKDSMITSSAYEGSELVFYTKNKDFFKTCTPEIKKLVSKFKKRIHIRCDPSILVSPEKSEELIRKKVPTSAGIKDIYFEPEFAKVVIHAEKPGVVIGKKGELMSSIKNETLWTIEIKRAPIIDSEIIKSIRKMLHKEVDYRKKFMNEIGTKIYESNAKSIDWIRMTCLGAFRQVGKSCVMLQTPQSKILLDVGIDAGDSERPFPYIEMPEFRIQELDAIVISHSHMDHCGFVPYLFEMGYRGPVYCTRPTRDTMALLTLDYIQICQRENKKPPYSSKSVEEMIKHCITLEYSEVSDITPDIRLTLNNAGHILGSSTIHLNIGNGMYNFLYTGDLKYKETKMFDKTFTDYARVEAVLIEGTYGGKNDKLSHVEGEDFLIEKCKETIERGGKMLIPSFAVGRAQEVISMLTESNLKSKIYLDGMLWDATAINTAYPEFMSQKMQDKILKKGQNPFTDSRLIGIGSQEERKTLMESSEPAIILATSGMLAGGPIMSYLEAFSKDEKNTLLFVGYQAEGTLGRRIQKGWKHVQLDNGKDIDLKLEIATTHGLSGHSDMQELFDFISNLKNKPNKIMVNHCENTKCTDFAREAHKFFRTETSAPKLLETIRLR